MKIETDRQALVDALSTIDAFIGPQNLPMLSCFLLTTTDFGFEVMGTDRTTWCKISVPAKVTGTGNLSAHTKKTLTLLRACSQDSVVIHTGTEKAKGVYIESGSSRSKFNWMEPGNISWPVSDSIPDSSIFQTKASELARAVDSVIYAAGKDTGVLCGVLFDMHPTNTTQIDLVGCNGNRLAINGIPVENNTIHHSEVMSRSVAEEVAKMCRKRKDLTVEIVVAPTIFIVTIGDIAIAASPMQGTYPNYRTIAKSEYPFKAKVQVAPLLAAVKRAAVFASKTSVGAAFAVTKDAISISISTFDLGAFEEEVVCVEECSAPFTMNLNLGYLLDALGTYNEVGTVFVDYTDKFVPIHLNQDDRNDWIAQVMS